MSGRGRGRGGGKGRGSKANQEPSNEVSELDESDYSPPVAVVEDRPKKTRVPSKSLDELKRNMDIAKSRIAVIIDSLEGDDTEATLKRNVVTAVKHLKMIHDLLDV